MGRLGLVATRRIAPLFGVPLLAGLLQVGLLQVGLLQVGLLQLETSACVADELPMKVAATGELPAARLPMERIPQLVFRPDLSDEAVLGLKRDHVLAATLKTAIESHQHVRASIRDYSCLLVRRERVDGRLGDFEYITVKLRHEQVEQGTVVVPFSLYLKFLGPEELVGREVLYVQGQNKDQIRARRGGRRFSYITGWLSLDSPAVLQGNRYPVTEVGIQNLLRRLIVLAREELGRDVCQVRYGEDAKVDERDCQCIQVVRPMPGQDSVLQSARIFIDKQLRVPVHFESYESRVGEPDSVKLMEQYTYRELRLNIGFTDADFDYTNPAYRLK